MSVSQEFTLRRSNRRNQIKEYGIQAVLIACSFVAIFTTIGIVASLVFEAYRFFGKIPLTEFLFGLEWSPQTALRSDQVGASGKFGVLPLLSGTLLISFIAMCVATPLGILSAVYLAEFAKPKTRNLVKPLLELWLVSRPLFTDFLRHLLSPQLFAAWARVQASKFHLKVHSLQGL